jgi:hypothetical protein
MDELKSKYVGKFIGPNKIADIEVTELTTPKGAAVFEVTYTLGHKELFPERGLVVVVTNEIKDLTYVRDMRVEAIVPTVIDLVQEYDLPGAQMNYLLTMIGTQWNNRFGRALNWLMFKDDKRYAAGYEPANDFSLLMAERVNKGIPPKENVE